MQYIHYCMLDYICASCDIILTQHLVLELYTYQYSIYKALCFLYNVWSVL